MSALPWTLTQEGDDYVVRNSTGEMLICDESYYPSAPGLEDAQFIVKAVNAHDELVEALKTITKRAHCLTEDTAEDLRRDLYHCEMLAYSALTKIGEGS